jgi:hypothetical protein
MPIWVIRSPPCNMEDGISHISLRPFREPGRCDNPRQNLHARGLRRFLKLSPAETSITRWVKTASTQVDGRPRNLRVLGGFLQFGPQVREAWAKPIEKDSTPSIVQRLLFHWLYPSQHSRTIEVLQLSIWAFSSGTISLNGPEKFAQCTRSILAGAFC